MTPALGAFAGHVPKAFAARAEYSKLGVPPPNKPMARAASRMNSELPAV